MIVRYAIFIFLLYLLSVELSGQDSIMYEQELDTSYYEEDSLKSLPFVPIDTFVKRNFETSFKTRYEGDAFDYTEKKAVKRNDPNISFLSGLSEIIVVIMYVIIGLAIIIGVYVLVSVLLGKEGAWLINRKSDDKAIFYGDDLQQVVDTDFKKLIQQALETNDLRSAIRYQYLYLLQKLSYKNIISLHKDKTNSDYQYEIKDTSLRQSFGYLSYIYDYAWYGEFTISLADYEQAARAFDETTQMI